MYYKGTTKFSAEEEWDEIIKDLETLNPEAMVNYFPKHYSEKHVLKIIDMGFKIEKYDGETQKTSGQIIIKISK